VVATVIFSLSVLNLFIAIYSNEYDRKEKQSDLLFFQERAGICLRHLMEPMWPSWQQQPAWFWSCWTRSGRRCSAETFVRWMVAACSLCLALLATLSAEVLSGQFLPVLLLAAVMMLLQVASKRCNWENSPDGERSNHFYLWICSRASFSRHDFQELKLEDSNRRVEEMHDTLRHVVRVLEKQMVDFRKEVQGVHTELRTVKQQQQQIQPQQQQQPQEQKEQQPPLVLTPPSPLQQPLKTDMAVRPNILITTPSREFEEFTRDDVPCPVMEPFDEGVASLPATSPRGEPTQPSTSERWLGLSPRNGCLRTGHACL